MDNPVIIGNATLYLGDCREVLPTLPKVDAVITDPPYGVNFKYEGRDDSEMEWTKLMLDMVPKMQNQATVVVMPVCAQQRIGWWYATFPPKWMMCWYKGASPTLSKIGFCDWEAHLVWGKPPQPVHDHFTVMATTTDSGNGHPCPKPIAYSEHLVQRFAKKDKIVIDPFMGSGTTGVACMNLGRKFIGIEIEPKYFDIACRRIEDAQRQQRMFA